MKPHPAPPALDDDSQQGLSPAEAARRLAQDGPNELSPPQHRTVWHILAELIREPMLQLLLAAGAIYLLLGNRGEALMLLAFVLLTVVISVSQEQRTAQVLEALRDLTSPRALVRRGGQAQRIAGREVVCGDLLLLEEGDRVAADALLLSSHDLQTDESLLSGESLAVDKRAGAEQEAGRVFAGSLVVGGQGLARVTATGVRSEIGRIGSSLAEIEIPPTPLHQQTRRLVRLFSILGLALSVLVLLLFGLLRGDWLGGVLAGITLAMSMLPQEFLLILTVFMAMGAWRLSQQRVLARRAATIETLGAATVLCSDKTGTLTVNDMAVAELAALGETPVRWVAAAGQALPEALMDMLDVAVLASEIAPIDAMERALHSLAETQLPPERRHPGWRLVHEYGLSPELPAMGHVWQGEGLAGSRLALKGAAEAVAALCGLSEAQRAQVAAETQAMAERGLRVLGVACADAALPGPPWPAGPQGFAGLRFLGLLAFADPLRPEVPEAIAQCRAAGLRVLMITGDHPATARAIAGQAGLDVAQPAITGPELAQLSDGALRQRLAAGASVFARIKPQQKLRIVEALKAQGEVVAMTGDGVNDAPSLKAAHIGIAMGGRGTDVAREASSLVLLDDRFSAIVGAVRLGRRIYDNLHKAMAFVLAVHVPIAGLSLLPLLFGWPLLLSPVHIAFLELLIDPVCSIVFEAEEEEADVMSRPPRDPAAPLFSGRLIAWSVAQGALILTVVGGLYAVLLSRGPMSQEAVRGTAFLALVSCNIALILASRSLSGRWREALLRPNRVLWQVLAATAVLLAAVFWLAPLREVFRFAALSPASLGLGLATGGLMLLVLLLLRRWSGVHP
ncbi:cation-translocating P-type ATPase [Paucibacter sp. B51]|uniref:cation-translocating P-type ATPase n=1 Tax=Paucibacter sp. B51 TaxID=2993315 RepID=UPI0022EBCB04|nr:cation-translocating P-type ATPase [Paucibacter sp. B51]